jgi:hypothetical protein
MKSRILIDEELFTKAVKENTTIAGVLRSLGKSDKSFGFYKTVHKYVKIFNLDTSHWDGKIYIKGKKRNAPMAPIEDVLSSNGNYDYKYVKRRILKDNLLPYECNKCNITDWLGEKLSLHLDHINGINDDHRLENLRFLCPNCHSLTSTYCGKNKKMFK